MMEMLYNSDSYAVVRFDVPGAGGQERAPRGGYEIVDKFARKEIFIEGVLADSFKQGVEALMRSGPSEEEVDAYIERYTSLMQQPVVLH
jgi:hypothetical protein